MPKKKPNPQRDVLEVFRGRGRATKHQWYWHRRARNGEIIAMSEGYTRKSSAIRGAERANPDVDGLIELAD